MFYIRYFFVGWGGGWKKIADCNSSEPWEVPLVPMITGVFQLLQRFDFAYVT